MSNLKEINDEKELSVLFLNAGGISEAITPLEAELIEDHGYRIDENGYVNIKNTIIRLLTVDGDDKVVDKIRNMGLPAVHIFQPTGRRARLGYEFMKKEMNLIADFMKKAMIDSYSIVLGKCSISGYGYAFMRVLSEIFKPQKPNTGLIRIMVIPSYLERGVEDSIAFFLEESFTYEHVKTIILQADVAKFVWDFLERPASVGRLMKNRVKISERGLKELKVFVNALSFDYVDKLILFIDKLILGVIKREIQLPGEKNIKRIDPWDFYNMIPQGLSTISVFPLKALNEYEASLHEAVTAGISIPIPRECLQEYVVIAPKTIYDDEFEPRGIALYEKLGDVGVAFVSLNAEKFRDFYSKKFLK